MKKVSLFLVLAFCLALAGCSKDAEVNAFVKDLDDTTNEMIKKIEAGDVDGAQSAFDAKKASLKSQWDEVKKMRGFQVSEAVQKKATEDVTKSSTNLGNAITKNAMKFATDKAKMDKLTGLLKEFGGIFQM